MTYVIMMNGHPACLKSTISKKLADVLNIPLVRTNAFGGTITASGYSTIEIRDRRYQHAFKQMESLLKEGKSLVFDGTFTRTEWRSQLYSLCQKYSVNEIIILRCISSNDNVVKERFMKRASLEEQAEKDSIYFKNYLRDVPLDNPPFSDIYMNRIPSIVVLDSAKLKIIQMIAMTNFSYNITKVFKDIVSKLLLDKDFEVK